VEAVSRFVKSREWNYSNWAGIGAALFFVFLLGLCDFEPTDAPTFENVTVVSYDAGPKNSRFTVESVASEESWEISRADASIPSNYRGLAILIIRHGRWTGLNHFQLLEGNALTNRPSIK
jgi:hypothetical protein